MTEISAPQKRFYDQGWNAAHRGEDHDPGAFSDWQEGWADYQTARNNLSEEFLTSI
jgi:hypothetical protein